MRWRMVGPVFGRVAEFGWYRGMSVPLRGLGVFFVFLALFLAWFFLHRLKDVLVSNPVEFLHETIS